MIRINLFAIFIFSIAACYAQQKAQPSRSKTKAIPGLAASDITWHSPGTDFHDAMPTGNGDIAISAWTQKNGELLFYISKSDAYDDNNRLLKLGLVRINISPNPFPPDSFFRQHLNLEQSEIAFQTGTGGNELKLRLWVDANHPVVHLEIKGNKKFTTQVKLENWRRHEYVVNDLAFSDVYNTSADGSKPGITMVQYPDSMLTGPNNSIVWYHHNKHSCWPFSLTLQGLQQLTKTQTDPLLNNIFGAAIYGEGLVPQNDTSLQSGRPADKENISILVQTINSTTPETWLRSLNATRANLEKINIEQYRSAHRQWWKQFWNRSYINIHTQTDTGAIITRAYVLQRYLAACSGRGRGWIKFNGSLFTLPYEHDADFRRWGSAQWFQNVRLVYWPLIGSGDFDLMAPFYATFLDALPLVRERTKLYYGHEGAFFSETAYRWGTYTNADYGYNRKGLEAGFAVNPFIRRHWSGGLELSAMMLQQYYLTNNKKFLTDTLLPIAAEVVKFYDQHWKRGRDGKIHFSPSQSLETWQTAVDPLPEIAGLKYVLQQLLGLPEKITTPQQREAWQKTMHDLPALPMKTTDGKTILLPADSITERSNSENPELYAIFPFRLYGVGKPSLEIAKNSYAIRANKEDRCWYQDNAQAAFLGLAGEAANGVTRRMTNHNLDFRFPAMWGPGNDELPDLDHGGVGQLAIQSMLMQTENNKILLFPAWPAAWDVSFRMPAPQQTVVEGEFRNGKLQKLVVSPASRLKDVTVMPVR